MQRRSIRGSSPLHVPRVTGFTFIELILVLLIVGTLVALASPRLDKAWRGHRVDNFAYSMGRLLATLGDRAVADTRVYRLGLSGDKMAYWTERARVKSEEQRRLIFKPIKGRYGRKRRVPDGVRLELDGEVPTFFPSGMQSYFTLSILEGGEPIYTITSKGVYGAVQLSRVTDAGI